MRVFNKTSLCLHTSLRSTALLALMATAGLSAPAFAQGQAELPNCTDVKEGEDCKSDEPAIVVTGSILRGASLETPSPVTTLSADTLEERGIATAAEGLQRVAANGAGNIGEGWNNGSNFATGANAVSLRGLTVQKTLTVFDGLRMAPYPLADDGHRNFVDLSTIPDAIVDRIEVLKDGASSTYGADAVAGVVNVITKKQVKGFHVTASVGTSEEGDGDEKRIDATAGYGDLDRDGFNIYVNASYRKNDRIWARDRDYAGNTSDLSKICQEGSTTICIANGVQFGINADGTLGSGTTTIAPLVAPSSATGTRSGEYRQLNTAGCGAFGLNPVTLNTTQRAFNAAGTIATWAANQCQQDLRAQYSTIRPETERYGFAVRMTARIGDKAEAYIAGNYYDTNTFTQLSPLAFNTSTTAPQTISVNPILLPVYVCAAGVGGFTYTNAAKSAAYNTSTGCTAANGTLNPNNPFAAAGSYAILRARYDRPRTVESDARSLRGAAGIQGSFGGNDEWNYSVEFTASQVRLIRESANYLIPQRLADVIANGTYNFANPYANTEAQRDYIAPLSVKRSVSDLWQGQAVLGRSLFELPGGTMQAAAGVSYREESINDVSANPRNDAHPFDRYYSINAVGAVGSRNVKSAFFEVSAPLVDTLEIRGSGRYDDYSSGQSNFSPKIGATWKPIEQVLLRSTFSKGFRIPSFNESYGLPTTGYITLSVNCTTYAAFCAAHGNNSYATGQYSLGKTATGNPNLDPEKSTAWSAGFVVSPISDISFSVDYFNIKVRNLIGGVSAAQQDAALDQYLKGQAVTVTGVRVLPQTADAQNPNALPLPGFIEYSYTNQDEEKVSGIDIALSGQYDFGFMKWRSSIDASYVLKYEVVRDDGSVERYDGTLSPCDYTSCSGSPKWRGTWQNSFDFGALSATLTTYYTSGYDLASVDYGGVKGDCVGNIGASVVAYKTTPASTTPVKCVADDTWNVDLNLRYKLTDNVALFGTVLNLFNIAAPFDPSAAYSGPQYNPAWAQPNIVGRYFRMGAKFDF